MKTFSNLLMILILSLSSSLSMAAKSDVSERILIAELEMKRDTIKEEIHKSVVQFNALEEETDDQDLLKYYHTHAKDIYMFTGMISGLTSANVAASALNAPSFTSKGAMRAMGTAVLVTALISVGSFVAASKQTDQPLYEETFDKLKSMNGEQKKQFAKEISDSIEKNLVAMKAIEAQLNGN